MISKSSRPFSRSNTWRPVVPTSTSIKTFGLAKSADVVRKADVDDDEKPHAAGVDRMVTVRTEIEIFMMMSVETITGEVVKEIWL